MNSSEFSRALERLGSRYLTEYTRNVERYAEFVSEMAKTPGASSGEGLGQRYLEFVRAEGPRVLGKVAEAGLSYYTVLLNTGIETTNRYFEQVLRAEGAKAEPPSPQPAPSALLFRGRRGESASNAFLVTNHRDQPIEVDFAVTECVSEDGGTRVRPSARFNPPTCRLAPHSEQVVQCTLDLSDEFEPDQTHRGQIQVTGFPEMAMRISVRVDEPEAGTQATVGKTKKSRPKKSGGKTPRAKKASTKRRGAGSRS